MSRAYGANNSPNVDSHYKRNRQSVSHESDETNNYKSKRKQINSSSHESNELNNYSTKTQSWCRWYKQWYLQ